MKIIISHDVDHLNSSDHYFKDLILIKLCVRSVWHWFQGKVKFSVLCHRFISVFNKRMHRIPEVIDFDKRNGIPSTFFFGMDNELGLSYSKKKVTPWIKYVLEAGFNVGVHGINYTNYEKMSREYLDFKRISGIDSFGIRMHYVRYDGETFNKLAQIGYAYDTSEFCKNKIDLKQPYKIQSMWEFPLNVMDGYVYNGDIEEAKNLLMKALDNAERIKVEFFSFLFHDYLFNEKIYPQEKYLYEWFVEHVKQRGCSFISYSEAINKTKEI